MSLAALKAELEKKRKANAPPQDVSGGNKYMRKGDVEKLQAPKVESKVQLNTITYVIYLQSQASSHITRKHSQTCTIGIP